MRRIREKLAGLIREEISRYAERSDLFATAFELAPQRGDYLEFGVFRGRSFVRAFRAAAAWSAGIAAGGMDHVAPEPEAVRTEAQRAWEARRFFAFDSFSGMPASGEVDGLRVIWPEGSYACTVADFHATLERARVPLEKVVTVPGFFQETLRESKRIELGIERVAVAHIDSDLYESATLALDFVTPALQSGTVLIFDEWFQYRGHPRRGEQRAFAEWRQLHPEWLVTEYKSAGTWAKSFVVNRDDETKLAAGVEALIG